MKNIEAFDLNLLRVFDALMRSRNVTRAAASVGLAQSSFSNALTRLRGVLGDELFVRAPGGMPPTALATRIAPHVATALDAARLAINDEGRFNPATANLTLRIATSDYAEFVLMPDLIRELSALAPGIRLIFQPLQRDRITAQLDAGEIDLAIGVAVDPPARHLTRVLLSETYVCISRTLPGARRPMDLDRFLSHRHALATLAADARGVVDLALEKMGLSRKVVVSSPSFLTLPFLVAEGDLIAVVPSRLANKMAAIAPVTLDPVPIALRGFSLSMIWALTQDARPDLEWFRTLLADLADRQPSPGAI